MATVDQPEMMCPFYESQTGSYITCEGVIGINQKTKFPSAFKKMKHMEWFCKTWDYKKCPQYRAVIKKYSD